jgi:lipopolysaccharide transport system permease protein
MFVRLRQDVREMFRELRDYRDLLLLMTQRTYILQYRRAVMGMAWAVFMPVLNTVVFTMIFARVARIDTGGIPYPLFAYCGLLPWNLFAVSLKKSVNDLVANKALLSKVYFPREIFPFSTMLVSMIDFVVGLTIVAAMMLYYQIPPTMTVLFVPIIFTVQLMFTAGLAMLLAPANLYYRDVKYVLDVLVAVGMFATPVIYPTRHLTGGLGVLLQLNPLAPIIDGYRAVLLRGELPHAAPFAAAAAFSLCLFAIGWLVFHRAEYAFAENA